MRLYIKIIPVLLVVSIFLGACTDMLDVKYDDIILADDHKMSSPNDTIYSMIGVLKELEKLGERYIVLGELRGDLLEITETARKELQDVYNFNVDADHPYANTRDYYEVINRCNLLIDRADTTVISKGQKVLIKEMTAAKAIRAWTYLQLLLNHGEAYYYEKPILSIGDADKITEKLTLEEIIPKLIADLEPYQNVEMPGGISLGDDIMSSRYMMIPAGFILGDLYLYNQEYEKAAQAYFDLMEKEQYLSTDEYTMDMVFEGNSFEYTSGRWPLAFDLDQGYAEIISYIGGSNEFGEKTRLDSIFLYNIEMKPTDVVFENFENQTYYRTATEGYKGDLRSIGIAGMRTSIDDTELTYYSRKLFYSLEEKTWAIPIYRIGTLYLRYAEAVNRAGKPSLAFAVLKDGLTKRTLENDSIVLKHEKTPLAPYMDFTKDVFNWEGPYVRTNEIIGIHARGCGNVKLVSSFRIPSLPTLQDSVLYVEDKIMEEYTLETYLEGNRFHDLIRVSKRRHAPEYLAEKVSEKYDSQKEYMKAHLLNEENWYLPSK